jgi:hypothetical protein
MYFKSMTNKELSEIEIKLKSDNQISRSDAEKLLTEIKRIRQAFDDKVKDCECCGEIMIAPTPEDWCEICRCADCSWECFIPKGSVKWIKGGHCPSKLKS